MNHYGSFIKCKLLNQGARSLVKVLLCVLWGVGWMGKGISGATSTQQPPSTPSKTSVKKTVNVPSRKPPAKTTPSPVARKKTATPTVSKKSAPVKRKAVSSKKPVRTVAKKTPPASPPAPPVPVNISKRVLIPPPLMTGTGNEVMKALPAFMDFDLPTDNQMLFSQVDYRPFFQPTKSRRTISAMFGCVRNPGPRGVFTRFHEGVDIRPVAVDDDGEPLDDVRSAGDGVVVYACRDEKDSNYGRYLVLEHRLFGVPFYTLYAHLSSVEDGIEEGVAVQKGSYLGRLGRTSNDFHIDTDQAHLHFEVDLMVNDRYVEQSRSRGAGEPSHGLYNGSNLLGVDPVRFLQFMQYNPDLGIGDFIKREKVAFRVLVPVKKDFSWVRRYPFALSKPVDAQSTAYEISMTYYGLPILVEPRSKESIAAASRTALSKGLYPLTYVSGREMTANPACKILEQKGTRWGLSSKGKEWINQLIY